MKVLSTCVLACTLLGGLVITGCEVDHHESTKPTFWGGTKTDSTTTVKTPVGDSTTHTETRNP